MFDRGRTVLCWRKFVWNVNTEVKKLINSVAWVRKRTVPTERQPLVGEVSVSTEILDFKLHGSHGHILLSDGSGSLVENRELRRIFGPKRDDATGGWRKLEIEELHKLHISGSIIRLWMRWTERAAWMRRGTHASYLWESQKERDH
jgi:hypothetical protein